jgi:hypothetical protein
MALLDHDGRLFGRINPVDALALVLLVGLLPLGVATYRVFRVPPPEILAIEPAVLAVGVEQRVRVDGRNLRPYLHAFIAPAGQAPAFVDLPKNPNEVMFLLERPNSAEIRLPKLAAGSYDLYLYDESREVVRRAPAFSVAAPPKQAPGTQETAVVDVVVRFDVDESVASLMKIGDRDAAPRSTWALKPAVINSVRRLPDPVRPAGFMLAADGTMTVWPTSRRGRAEAVVRIGVVNVGGAWLYGDRQVRAGETFTFSTEAWIATGLMTRVTVVPGLAAQKVVR